MPSDRVRQVSAFIEEWWEPVYARTDSTDLVQILLVSQRQIGWRVTQHESRASREARKARINAEQFEEVCISAQIQASDEFYQGYYETIKGNDPVILDGKVLMGNPEYEILEDGSYGGIIKEAQPIRGGTQIKSRKHYNAATKGMVHWDRGTWQEHVKAVDEMNSRGVRNTRRALESYMGELPMWRATGVNFRRDRRSAV